MSKKKRKGKAPRQRGERGEWEAPPGGPEVGRAALSLTGESSGHAEYSNPLEEATAAAKAGDPVRMVEILLEKGALAGVLRYQRGRWRNIPEDELERLLACSVTELYWYIDRGNQVENLLAWIIKVADRMALRYLRTREEEMLADVSEMDAIPTKAEKDEPVVGEDIRTRVLRIARGYLPKLGQETAQRVMAHLFDAVEAGVVDISRTKMAADLGLSPQTVRTAIFRGFQRLKRLAKDDGLDLGEVGKGAEDDDDQGDEDRLGDTGTDE